MNKVQRILRKQFIRSKYNRQSGPFFRPCPAWPNSSKENPFLPQQIPQSKVQFGATDRFPLSPTSTIYFRRVPEEKSTRSKTTPLLSYRDTLYIYPETGCVDVVPTGYVSGIPSLLVVDNSPPSAFAHPLARSLAPSLPTPLDSTTTASLMVLPNNYPLPPPTYRQTPTSLCFCLPGIDIIRSGGLQHRLY